MQNDPEPAVPLIAVFPSLAESFCVWFRLHVCAFGSHTPIPIPSAVTVDGLMAVKPASSVYPELFTVKLWIIVPPWPIDPLKVSVTTVGVGPVSALPVLEFPLFVQPNDAAAASTPSANMNWRMAPAEQKLRRS